MQVKRCRENTLIIKARINKGNRHCNNGNSVQREVPLNKDTTKGSTIK